MNERKRELREKSPNGEIKVKSNSLLAKNTKSKSTKKHFKAISTHC